MERAILDHLGQYSDPDQVKVLLAQEGGRDVKQWRQELARSHKRLADLDRDFHKNVDLVKRQLVTDAEFRQLNERTREERATLEGRRAELAGRLAEAQAGATLAAELPGVVRSFLEDMQALPTPQAKAILQTILAEVRVHSDGRVELEFRRRG